MGVGRRRYVVEVSSAQALKLSHEQMALAASVDNGPTRLLVFPDRFLAAKIASLSGGTFRQGQLAPVGPVEKIAEAHELGRGASRRPCRGTSPP